LQFEPVPVKFRTWLVLTPFTFTGPLNVQPDRVATAVNETGRFAVIEIEYAPVASAVAESTEPPLSWITVPVRAVLPGPSTLPETVMLPTTAPTVFERSTSPLPLVQALAATSSGNAVISRPLIFALVIPILRVMRCALRGGAAA
jgi:hypothetical protein